MQSQSLLTLPQADALHLCLLPSSSTAYSREDRFTGLPEIYRGFVTLEECT